MKELLARIRALTRRPPLFTTDNVELFDIVLDTGSTSLTCNSTVRLSNKELDLMLHIMMNPDIALSTDYLIEHIWKNEENANNDTVYLYISYLKRKLQMIGSTATITGEKGGEFKIVSA